MQVFDGSQWINFNTRQEHDDYINNLAPNITVGADILLTQTQFDNIPTLTNQTPVIGLIVKSLAQNGTDWNRLEYTGTTGSKWNITVRKINLLNFYTNGSVNFSDQTVGAQTIDIATFPIPQNIIGKSRIEVFIVDTVSGNLGIADITVTWRRYTNGVAVVSTHQIIPLQTPGTLAGASLPALAVVGNSIVARFTGVAGRTITVYAKFTPTYVKF